LALARHTRRVDLFNEPPGRAWPFRPLLRPPLGYVQTVARPTQRCCQRGESAWLQAAVSRGCGQLTRPQHLKRSRNAGKGGGIQGSGHRRSTAKGTNLDPRGGILEETKRRGQVTRGAKPSTAALRIMPGLAFALKAGLLLFLWVADNSTQQVRAHNNIVSIVGPVAHQPRYAQRMFPMLHFWIRFPCESCLPCLVASRTLLRACEREGCPLQCMKSSWQP